MYVSISLIISIHVYLRRKEHNFTLQKPSKNSNSAKKTTYNYELLPPPTLHLSDAGSPPTRGIYKQKLLDFNKMFIAHSTVTFATSNTQPTLINIYFTVHLFLCKKNRRNTFPMVI